MFFAFTIVILFLALLLAGILAFKKSQKLIAGTASRVEDQIVLQVLVPKDIEQPFDEASKSMQTLLTSLHGLGGSEAISFEIESRGEEGIGFYVCCNTKNKSYIENQIYAQYAGAQIIEIEDHVELISENPPEHVVSNTLTLAMPQFFPIRDYTKFEADPLSSIAAMVSEIKKGDRLILQIIVRPENSFWHEEADKHIEEVKTGKKSFFASFFGSGFLNLIFRELGYLVENFFRNVATPSNDPKENGGSASEEKAKELSPREVEEIDAIEEKKKSPGYTCTIRYLLTSSTKESLDSYENSLVSSFSQYSNINLNSFKPSTKPNNTVVTALDNLKERKFDEKNNFILNVMEASSIFHFPSGKLETPKISRTKAKKGEPPNNLPIEEKIDQETGEKNNITFIGETNFREKSTKFGLNYGPDRLKHLYVLGKTGSGKSEMFMNMIIQDIEKGYGCGYIDPHGSAIEDILRRMPKDRLDDVILFDPSDTDMPLGLNLMECPDPSQKELMASGVLASFALQFGHSWGPRLEYLLNYSILTLISVPGTTLLGIVRLLQDKNYRKYILEHCDDPVIKDFWEKEYEEFAQSKIGVEAIAPIQNKVGRFLSNKLLRNILGQKYSSLDFEEIMNGKKILLVNLSKGKIGDDNSSLLGALLVNRLMFFALKREEMEEKDRLPFYLYVDEFQNFATDSFITILSEARKYGLSLNLTNQYTSQLSEEIKDSILGNVGSILCMTLGAQDAAVMAPEFAPTFTEQDLVNQERFSYYCKLQIDGFQSQPFSAKALPPREGSNDNAAFIRQSSRDKYGTPKWYIEERIERWVKRPFDLGLAIAEKYNKK